MERLILFRHGKAEAASPSGEDFDRGLTDRGISESALMAKALAEAGYRPDLVLVSAAVRTRQTWQAVEPAFSKPKTLFLRSLFHASAEEILAEAGVQAEETGAQAVMVVGHNPGLHQLCLELARRCKGEAVETARLNTGFPTAAACVFDLKARRFRLLTPKGLGA
jgi:phosphohistidine phosphatase